MRLTLIRKDLKNLTHVTLKPIDSFMERVKTDTKAGDVAGLRRHVALIGREARYAQMHRLPVVCPAAELSLDTNGNMVMNVMNGVLLLSIESVRGQEAQRMLKAKAMMMPSTLAALTGSSGETVKVLVSIGRPGGTLPTTTDEANHLLATAFALVRKPYEALLGVAVSDRVPTVTTGFRMTLDAEPQFNPRAVPFTVNAALTAPSAATIPAPATTEQLHHDYDLFTHYEHLYRQAIDQVRAHIPDDADDGDVLPELARQLCLLRVPEEEAVTHIWAHHKYQSAPPFTEERVRAVVASTYAETSPDRRTRGTGDAGREMRQLMQYLQGRYVFRYNTIMGYTEYRPNNTWMQDWQPVDERTVNGFTTDARLAGLEVWDRDVTRYVKSDKIRPFNPVEEYLWQVHTKWDGRDHIGRLAQTVPTDCKDWPRWFRTWMLAMVAQWSGKNRRYGNSVAPLLISHQGYNKSTFCRSLLPEELQWGYTDSLSLDEKRAVLQAMSQMLLVNLDEFNQISARTQEGFLKNVIQLARVKAKRPYGRHVEDFPRLASFIATTNMADVLADPSGNRRFIGIELTGPIDVSTPPNHEQLYAQAQTLLERGEPYWFDDQETQLIMKHNRKYQLRSPAEQYFHELFDVAAPSDPDARWLTTAAILQRIKKAGTSSLKQPNLIAFGRMLTNLDGMQRRRSVNGTEYLVRER